MGKYVGILGALALIAYIGVTSGLTFFFPPQAESSPSPSAVQPAALSFPIPFVATITQYGDGISEPRTHFYVPRSERGQ